MPGKDLAVLLHRLPQAPAQVGLLLFRRPRKRLGALGPHRLDRRRLG